MRRICAALSRSTLRWVPWIAAGSLLGAGGAFTTWTGMRLLTGNWAVTTQVSRPEVTAILDLATGEQLWEEMGAPEEDWLLGSADQEIPDIVSPPDFRLVTQFVSNLEFWPTAGEFQIQFPWAQRAAETEYSILVSSDLVHWEERSPAVQPPNGTGGPQRGTLLLRPEELDFRFLRVIRTYKMLPSIGSPT